MLTRPTAAKLAHVLVRIAVCGDHTWIEGNWLLLCDGDGCNNAYHTRCLNPMLTIPA